VRERERERGMRKGMKTEEVWEVACGAADDRRGEAVG
jgi:hypothetical protein